MSTTPFESSPLSDATTLPGVWRDPRQGRIELVGRLPELEWTWFDGDGTQRGRGVGKLTGNRIVLHGDGAEGGPVEWHLVWYAGALTGFVVSPRGERPVKLWPVSTEGSDVD